MDLKRFGEQLQRLRKEAGLSQERLVAALEKLAQAGPRIDYRVIDGTLISRWEQARVQKGRYWRPTRPYLLYLIRLFAGHLDRDKAQEWAIQGGYKLTTDELQSLFPITSVKDSPEHFASPTPGPSYRVYQATAAAPERAQRTLDLSEMPLAAHLHGRTVEVTALEQWLQPNTAQPNTAQPSTAQPSTAQPSAARDRMRLVAVLGMGGMGKTALVAHVVHRLTTQFPDGFHFVLWRSLLNAPPLSEVLRDWLPILSRQTLITVPTTVEEQIELLLHYLRQERCLLVLDNLESILQAGEPLGQMRPGYKAYDQLLQWIGSREHQSCLLLTSREQPQMLDLLLRNTAMTRILALSGLDPQAGKALLLARGLPLLSHQATTLVHHYSGNPLALQIVANTIADWYAGDLEAFQREGTPVFHDIRSVLDQQVDRLSELEHDLLVWLAIEREAVAAPVLRANLVQKWPAHNFLEALHALARRSLLLKQHEGFTLQNVVLEYITGRLIEAVCTELRADIAQWEFEEVREKGRAPQHDALPYARSWFNRFALRKAQAKEYVRQSQERLILQPIVEQMTADFGSSGFVAQLNQLLARLHAARKPPPVRPGYAASNLLNLLLTLNVDLTGYDFSQVALWQAYLQGVDLPNVNLAGTDLKASVFTKNFGLCRVLAFAPDGKVLGGGMTNGEIHLWQPDDGQPVAMIKVHETRIWDMAFSPDGQWLVSGSKDQTVRLTDRATGQCLRIFTGHSDWVRTVAFHPGGQIIASGSQDQSARLWDVASGQLLHLLPHEGWILDLAFSPDGAYVATVGTDQRLYLWDVATGQKMGSWHEHHAAIYTVTFSPDGSLLATGSDDRTLRLWEVAALVACAAAPCRTVLTGHHAGIYVAAFSLDGTQLFSGGAEAVIRVWDVATGQALHTLTGHQREVNSLTICPMGPMLATGEADTSMIYLWDRTPQPRARYTHLGYRHWTNAIAFHPQWPLLAGATANGQVDLWQATAGRYLQTFRGAKSMSRALAFGDTADGALVHLAVGSTDGTVRLWRINSHLTEQQMTVARVGEPIGVLQAPGEIHAVAFNRHATQIFAGGYDGAVHRWDVATGQRLQPFNLPGDPRIKSIAVSPDDQFLAVGSHNNTVALWEVATQRLRELQGHTAWIWTVAFHPAGRYLATGSFDRTVRLWALPTGDLQYTLPHPSSLVQVIAFSPLGNRLAVGMGDATIYLWATEGLLQTPHTPPTLIAKLYGHADLIQGLAFTQDGTLLASASLDGTMKLWDMQRNVCHYTVHAPGPYSGMNITGVTGITEAQQEALKALGAISA